MLRKLGLRHKKGFAYKKGICQKETKVQTIYFVIILLGHFYISHDCVSS